MTCPNRLMIAGALASLVLGLGLAVHAFARPANDFHFAILGDRTGSAEPQVFARVWREMDLLDPDFVLNVGDLIQGRNDETAEREWRELAAVWKRYRHAPLYFTPGNHDIWSEVSRQVYERETGRKPYYGFDYQNMHFTVLDTSRTVALGPDQLAFLEKDLKAHAGRHPKLVVFHRPFWLQAIREQGTDFPLHRLAKKYGVGHIVSGHGHRLVRRHHDGVNYMEVGSSGASLRGRLARGEGFDKGFFYQFVWGRVERGEVRFAVKEIGGPAGQGRMFPADEWNENGPRFDPADPAGKEIPQS